MGSKSSEGEPSHHVIHIWEVNKEKLASMQAKISEEPKSLSKAAGKRTCCIFKFPQSLIGANGQAYHPQIVSIGPYYRGEPCLNMIEEHKGRYLGSLLSRTQTKGITLKHMLEAIAPLEPQAREWYSETIQLNTDDFIEMLVLDGCFIIELFRKFAGLVPFEINDPLDTMSCLALPLRRDFLKLGNQIPFFILERLFELSKLPRQKPMRTMSSLVLEFFGRPIRPDKVIAQNSNTEWMHLLDLVRSSYIPSDDVEVAEPKRVMNKTPVIHCVSKLRRAGIKINPGKDSESFLHVTFRNGVIEMPTISVDDFMNCFLLNCVAFEQCYSGCSQHFTTYVTLLDCLIDTDRDVGYLCEWNIIENFLGSEEEAAHFINNAGKDVTVDLDSCYLSHLFTEVHQYYRNSWNVHWATFKYTYFDSPWSFISALAALVLLVLTVAQAYFACYQFFDLGKLNWSEA